MGSNSSTCIKGKVYDNQEFETRSTDIYESETDSYRMAITHVLDPPYLGRSQKFKQSKRRNFSFNESENEYEINQSSSLIEKEEKIPRLITEYTPNSKHMTIRSHKNYLLDNTPYGWDESPIPRISERTFGDISNNSFEINQWMIVENESDINQSKMKNSRKNLVLLDELSKNIFWSDEKQHQDDDMKDYISPRFAINEDMLTTRFDFNKLSVNQMNIQRENGSQFKVIQQILGAFLCFSFFFLEAGKIRTVNS